MIKLILNKNRLVLVILVLFSVAFIPTTIFAGQKTVTVSGQQIKGSPGSNAKLISKAVRITKTSKIIAVKGNNKGFWISTRSGIIAKYWKSNDKRVIGRTLKPGTYFIYPNLKRGQNNASVTITIK